MRLQNVAVEAVAAQELAILRLPNAGDQLVGQDHAGALCFQMAWAT